MQISVSELEKFIANHPELKKGCIVDTNVIFATSYPLDNLNEWGEEVYLNYLQKNKDIDIKIAS